MMHIILLLHSRRCALNPRKWDMLFGKRHLLFLSEILFPTISSSNPITKIRLLSSISDSLSPTSSAVAPIRRKLQRMEIISVNTLQHLPMGRFAENTSQTFHHNRAPLKFPLSIFALTMPLSPKNSPHLSRNGSLIFLPINVLQHAVSKLNHSSILWMNFLL